MTQHTGAPLTIQAIIDAGACEEQVELYRQWIAANPGADLAALTEADFVSLDAHGMDLSWGQDRGYLTLDGTITGQDGTVYKYKSGKLHSDVGPAVVKPNGKVAWYRDGSKIRKSEAPGDVKAVCPPKSVKP